MPAKLSSEQATTFAIIVNELIANAIEHGFEGRERGEIRMSEDLIDGWVVFRVADDGQGIPEGFDIETANSMGLRLVRELVVRNSMAMWRCSANTLQKMAIRQLAAGLSPRRASRCLSCPMTARTQEAGGGIRRLLPALIPDRATNRITSIHACAESHSCDTHAR